MNSKSKDLKRKKKDKNSLKYLKNQMKWIRVSYILVSILWLINYCLCSWIRDLKLEYYSYDLLVLLIVLSVCFLGVIMAAIFVNLKIYILYGKKGGK